MIVSPGQIFLTTEKTVGPLIRMRWKTKVSVIKLSLKSNKRNCSPVQVPPAQRKRTETKIRNKIFKVVLPSQLTFIDD